MNLKTLQDFIDRETIKKAEVQTARRFAIGISLLALAGLAAEIGFALKASRETRRGMKEKAVDTVGNIRNAVLKKKDAVRDSAEQVSEDVRGVMDKVQESTENVAEDLQKGAHTVIQDIHKAAKDSSGDDHRAGK